MCIWRLKVRASLVFRARLKAVVAMSADTFLGFEFAWSLKLALVITYRRNGVLYPAIQDATISKQIFCRVIMLTHRFFRSRNAMCMIFACCYLMCKKLLLDKGNVSWHILHRSFYLVCRTAAS